MMELRLEMIHWQILHFLKKQYMMHCVVTHKAQNIHFHEHIMNDWVTYNNRHIVVDKYEDACIINIDEMNVEFDPLPSRTLCKIGDQKVSACISGNFRGCTVMLGCTASGVKLPAFIKWKGVPGGRIEREMRVAGCPHDNIMYAVQQRLGWTLQCTRSEYLQCCIPMHNSRNSNKNLLPSAGSDLCTSEGGRHQLGQHYQGGS
jgi:hypothetical protein